MSDIKTKNIGDLDIITELADTDYVLVESEGEMKRINGGSITPSQEENHWESNFMLPDGYVKYGSSKVYTESEAITSGDTYCAVYYLPEEIDLDAMSRLEVVAHCCQPASGSTGASYCFMLHETSNSLSDTFAVNWSNNCQGITLGQLSVVKASSFTSGQDAYEFPSNVKTIAVYIPLFKPGQYTGHPSNFFVFSISLDWTPSE